MEALSPVGTAETSPTKAIRNPLGLEMRRRSALVLLESGVRPASVARALGVSRAAVSQWQRAVLTAGPAGLRAIPKSGRRPTIPRHRTAELLDVLRCGPRACGVAADVWTLGRIRDFLAVRWRIRVSETTVSRWLRLVQPTWTASYSLSRPSAEVPEPRHVRWRGSGVVASTSGPPGSIQFIMSFGCVPFSDELRQYRK
jgi:transposase